MCFLHMQSWGLPHKGAPTTCLGKMEADPTISPGLVSQGSEGDPRRMLPATPLAPRRPHWSGIVEPTIPLVRAFSPGPRGTPEVHMKTRYCNRCTAALHTLTRQLPLWAMPARQLGVKREGHGARVDEGRGGIKGREAGWKGQSRVENNKVSCSWQPGVDRLFFAYTQV